MSQKPSTTAPDPSFANVFDVVVIGAGPGGYVAAIRAAHHGLKVAIVERDPNLGGTCLLRGCIPTKSLLHSADLYTSTKQAKHHGVIAKDVSLDFAGVQAARAKQVKLGAGGVAYLMKQNKIEVVAGHGRLHGQGAVEVTQAGAKRLLQAKHIVLATGSVPRSIPGITIDRKHFISSDEALELSSVPKSMIIMGAGAVGVEFASIFSRFGSHCAVVEMQDRLVPVEDVDISREFGKILSKQGIAIHTNTKLLEAKVVGENVVATIETAGKSQTLTAEKMLVAIGRAPVTHDLGLETIKLAYDKGGYIAVDAMMRTQVPGVYAIGDIVRTPWLAHVASSEAVVAIDHIAGKNPAAINYKHVPGCTYASPEIGSVGLTEAAAKDAGYDVKIGKYPFSAVPKARILGETEGFVKIVASKRYDELLGVHIIGPRATDLIAEACVALSHEATAESLAHTMHAHPSLAESVLEAAHAATGRALHM